MPFMGNGEEGKIANAKKKNIYELVKSAII